MTHSRKDERPFSTDKRERYGIEGDEGAEDAGQVDVDVLAVSGRDGGTAGGDVVAEKDDGKVGAGEVEGPVVALFSMSAGDPIIKKQGKKWSSQREGLGGYTI